MRVAASPSHPRTHTRPPLPNMRRGRRAFALIPEASTPRVRFTPEGGRPGRSLLLHRRARGYVAMRTRYRNFRYARASKHAHARPQLQPSVTASGGVPVNRSPQPHRRTFDWPGNRPPVRRHHIHPAPTNARARKYTQHTRPGRPALPGFRHSATREVGRLPFRSRAPVVAASIQARSRAPVVTASI